MQYIGATFNIQKNIARLHGKPIYLAAPLYVTCTVNKALTPPLYINILTLIYMLHKAASAVSAVLPLCPYAPRFARWISLRVIFVALGLAQCVLSLLARGAIHCAYLPLAFMPWLSTPIRLSTTTGYEYFKRYIL